MPNKSDFYNVKNSIDSMSNDELDQTSTYLEPIKAFARLSADSFYIIDYKDRGFDYVSDNPLFLCGRTAEEVQEMGYGFYLKYVTEKDQELLLKINKIGFDFYEQIPVAERKNYSMSYDFHLKIAEDKVILVNQRLTPIFLTKEGKVWKTLCIVSLSKAQEAGNIKIFIKEGGKHLEYDDELNVWNTIEETQLSDREKDILLLSLRGYNVDEIGKKLFISSNTIKFHRKKMFEKFEVSNIGDALSYAKGNYLI